MLEQTNVTNAYSFLTQKGKCFRVPKWDKVKETSEMDKIEEKLFLSLHTAEI